MEAKTRIIQELVPGRQITLAHIIASPDPSLFMGLDMQANPKNAIGVLTITPPEAALIIADIAIKAAGVKLVSLDITSGSVIITGTVSQTEAAVAAILDYVSQKLDFAVCGLTKT